MRTSLVCTEYEAIYNKLLVENVSCDGVGGVVVTGQPGIGMCLSPAVSFLNVNPVPRESCFLFYLLFCLLNSRKVVAFQVDERFLLFEDTGILLYDASVGGMGCLILAGTWALTDSHSGLHPSVAGMEIQ